MIVCSQCGFENTDKSVFCKKCHRYFRREEREGAVLEQTSPVRVVQQSRLRETVPSAPAQQLDLNTRVEQNIYGRPRPEYTQGSQEVDAESQTHQIQASGGGNLKLVALIALVVLFGSAIGLYVAIKPTDADAHASNLFVQAERLLEEENYSASIVLFQQFVTQYPENKLSEIAAEKISKIRAVLLSTEEQESRIQFLLSKTESAIVSEQYVEPSTDCALTYLSEILILDPGHQSAIDLRDQIVGEFNRKATLAASNNKFHFAKRNFQNILKFLPGDRYAQAKVIEMDRAIVAAREKQQKAAEIAASASTPPVDTEIASRLNMNNSEDINVDTEDEQPATNADLTIAANTETLANTDSNPEVDGEKDAASDESILSASIGTSSGVRPKETASTPSSEPKVEEKRTVIEALLDAGSRQYVYREKVEYPLIYLRSGIEGQVFIEVVVDTDGTVQDYRVLKSTMPLFAEAAAKALKSFKYEPGTMKNEPVQFKLVERFDFLLE